MSPLSLRAIALAALVSTSSAVSLGNFKPFLDNLSASCTTVYNSQIAGCTADDFSVGATCSDACVQGLNQIQAAVMKNCTKDNVSPQSIIGVFQNNVGLASLCPNNKSGPSSSSSATAKVTSSTTSTKPTSTTASSMTTSSANSATSSMSGLVLDPTPRSSFSTSIVDQPTATTAQPSSSETKKPKASATRGANGQLSNQSSGGGSPFDVQATNSSLQLRITSINLATILATVSLLFACS